MASQIVSVEQVPPEFLEELGLVGRIPSSHCLAAPQFSYYLYIPRGYRQLDTLSLIVLVHGSGRNAYQLREEFVSLAERRGCAVLCPLFPTGLLDPNDTNNYKMVKYGDVRYDNVVLRMADETHMRYPRIDTSRFLLWGFSGGGQFVHRFAYLHPEKLMALAVGAPGTVTLLDPESEFPGGISNFAAVFGTEVNLEALKAVPTLFVAGDADTGSFHAVARGRTIPAGYRGRYGETQRLEKSWADAGMQCGFVTVSRAGHEESKMLPSVKDFFEKRLAEVSDATDHAML
ncbi:hypothetical protein UA08_01808 [Talaromyces atroroseus]|uniref:Uncharacterized protein n=1 Tax=Talaromyces atroroseus TaxID=1441469 RepID=A0A1Q5QBQ3_TALAT|nr:hypothetical protein UA08_01808 [Talaromyces atroroseus]OKL63311.1 hypothetical protein UA08_01808 [Talaromyces atroroseus]